MVMQVVFPRRTITLLVASILLVVGAMFSYVYLPQATITVYPTVTTRIVEQEIILSSSVREPDFTRFVLPAKQVERQLQEEQKIVRSTDSTQEDFARGRVVFKNTQAEEQNLLPKTHLRHEATGVFFLTDSAVRIPPEGEMAVTVTAKEKGPAGNVPGGKFIIDKLPASSQALLWAESSQPFSGGLAADTPVTQTELDQAFQKVKETAEQRLLGELTLAAGGAPLRSDLVTVEVAEQTASAQVGQKVPDFTIRLSLRGRGFVVDENNLLSLTLLALRTKVQPEEEFLTYHPDSFAVTISRADFARGELHISSRLSGDFGQKISPSILTPSNIAGLSAREVQERFEAQPTIARAEVAFSPFWVSSVPSRPEAVSVRIKNGQQ